MHKSGRLVVIWMDPMGEIEWITVIDLFFDRITGWAKMMLLCANCGKIELLYKHPESVILSILESHFDHLRKFLFNWDDCILPKLHAYPVHGRLTRATGVLTDSLPVCDRSAAWLIGNESLLKLMFFKCRDSRTELSKMRLGGEWI